ncbi:hypothetical protein BGZ81_007296 [Podila clonocystis]|nr:hypothetical protein BGZ81_007296 [Podila clonocystis]
MAQYTGLLPNRRHSDGSDFLVSIPWPTSSPTAPLSEQSPPELWFLTGETRMKTMAQTLAAHQKPFQEVVVYETGPSPEFDHELENWLISSFSSFSTTSSTSSAETSAETRENTLWMVGFSPRGVDLSIPALKRFIFAEGQGDMAHTSDQKIPVCLRWAAIGPTTAKQIQQHLQEFSSHAQYGQEEQARRRYVDGSVTVAKSPNPVALAESIAAAMRE